MTRTARATLIFPRSGQRIQVNVPLEQYDAVVRRNQQLIHYFSAENPAGERRRNRRHCEEVMKISSLAG